MTVGHFTSYHDCGCSDLRLERAELQRLCPLHGTRWYGADTVTLDGLALGFATMNPDTKLYNTPTIEYPTKENA